MRLPTDLRRAVTGILLALPLMWVTSHAASTETPRTFVGAEKCASCHTKEHTAWSGSHHDLAMQPATSKTVLGDFNNSTFRYFNTQSRFFRRNGKFYVHTDGADGAMQDFEIKYTFGVEPLQQYLIELPGGHVQALSIAWDSRPKAQGGQRWFHLYPDEHIDYTDPLHWTRMSQNWNSSCAECHSTNLQKHYNAAKHSFATRWSEINVACEACHGPGSQHLTWAASKPDAKKRIANKGLPITLKERAGVSWKISATNGNAVRSTPRTTQHEIQMCARCHSRRAPITKAYSHGDPFLDHYRLRLLDEGMYFPDGQIQDEVYVYGSFIQSKMYHAGVTCSDCHEPHSLKLRGEKDGVCLQCHAAGKYNSSKHHFHETKSVGASCVECHMPPRTYMVVDPRHDHSIRIPRPDLSVSLGVPNACNTCHTDKDANWAAEHVRKWYGHQPKGFQQFAPMLAATRAADPKVAPSLYKLANDPAVPAITRATAVSALGLFPSAAAVESISKALQDTSPLVRVAAVSFLDQAPMAPRVKLVAPLLNDPVRLVRIEAARVLAPVPPDQLTPTQKKQRQRGLTEYIRAQLASAERPEAHTNLGNLYSSQGKFLKAEAEFKSAIRLSPEYIPAYINLVDLYRVQGKDAQGIEILQKAMAASPNNATVYHALGLLKVRQKRTAEAVSALKKAAELAPNQSRYGYVYAIALNSTGKPKQAINVLEQIHQYAPNDTAVLSALVSISKEQGNEAAARRYLQKLGRLTEEINK